MSWDHSKIKLNNTGIYTALFEVPAGFYEPPFDLVGKTVLDVGATCGEVAAWFVEKHHAARVVCVENDPVSLPFLRLNADLLGCVEVVAEGFCAEHLRRFHPDFVKCDVEGYEMELLRFVAEGGTLPPTVLEAHTNWISDQFLKAGFKVTKVVNDTRVQVAVYMMTNYESLGLK